MCVYIYVYIRVYIKDNSKCTKRGAGIGCEGGKEDRRVQGIQRKRGVGEQVEEPPEEETESRDEDMSSQRRKQPRHSQAVHLPGTLRTLPGPRRVCLARGGPQSLPARSGHTLRPSRVPAGGDVERRGRHGADGGRGVPGPRLGTLGNFLLPPSFLKLLRGPSDPGPGGLVVRCPCIIRFSLRPGPSRPLPLVCMATHTAASLCFGFLVCGLAQCNYPPHQWS